MIIRVKFSWIVKKTFPGKYLSADEIFSTEMLIFFYYTSHCAVNRFFGAF